MSAWTQPTVPVRGIRVRWIGAPGLIGEDEAKAVAYAIAGALGTLLGCWLAGLL